MTPAIPCRGAGHRRGRLLHGLIVVLVLWPVLAGGVLLAGAQVEPERVAFEAHELALGSAPRQTVLTGFLLGGAVADLAVVSISESDDRLLRIYGFEDGDWVPRLEATLRPDVRFIDVANIGDRDRLVTYEPGRVNWFDPGTATEHMLVSATSDFNPPRRGEIPHVDISRDVTGDGRDDLLVPDVDGFQVFVQMGDGRLAPPVKLGTIAERGRVYGADGYRYDPWVQGRVHQMDYDRDGRSDLVFWNRDHFEVHLQDARGLFSQVGETFTTEVAFDSDELTFLSTDLKGKVLDSLNDLNGDGVGDLAVLSLEGRSLLGKHTTYEVHFGAPAADGGTVFAADAGTAIESEGIQLGMTQHDFDRDGSVDMSFTTINPGVVMMIRAVIARSMPLDLEFYRMEGGIYPDGPNATRKIKPDFPPKEQAEGLGPALRSQDPGGGDRRRELEGDFYPSVLIGDVNGDDRADLLVGRSRKELRVFLGVPGPNLFVRRPQKLAVAMPSDEEYTWLVDLNRDGKQDILMHHPSTREPHRLTMWIAQ